MRYSLFIKIVLCCICWQLFIASVFADEKNVLRVEAMGSASVSLTTTQLDNLVVDDAFRRAVAKAVEALVPREELDKISLMLEDKIYSNAARYILNYRVISKEMIADDIPLAEGGVPIYNVLIEADISMDLLTKDLIAAGVLSEAEVKKVAVILLNVNQYKTFELFRKNLRGLKGVKDIHYRSFSRGKIELLVDVAGGAQILKEGILGMEMKGWGKEVIVVSGWFTTDRIEIKFVPSKE
ncbi:MAG: hypothetical protein A3F88_09780 [Deltaproteobacteria bacterium RIFCSPLOWO2_12_FULL_42_16]|nr:MAG: hypothetical protein A3F88_09780 [Deltaproteobacteria bacterium RIFCSPLOWO2_12_FULL_42_16]HAS16493.1 hypothetical protein [Nitrospiraceae bacterium]